MPSLSFEVGAIFLIEDRATAVLTDISRAFETLGELATGIEEKLMGIGEGAFAPMLAGIERASSATRVMVEQIGVVSDAWGRAAGAAERYGSVAGAAEAAGAVVPRVGGGGGGRRGGLTDDELARRNDERVRRDDERVRREAERQLAEDRRNADAINRNEDQIYRRQEAAARRENDAFDRAAKADDGITIPPPPRTGITEINRQRPILPREDLGPEILEKDVGAGARGRAGGGGSGGAHGRLTVSESGPSAHVSGGVGLGPLAFGFGVFKGEESAMEEQKNITETLAGINVTPDDPKFQEDYDRLHKMLYEQTEGTKYSNLQASKIMLESLPTLGFSGDKALDAGDTIFRTALNAGELSAFRGKGDPGKEAKAAFQFAHLSGEFDPGAMSKEIDIVNAISFRQGTSIAEQESIMKYGLPVALLAGIAPEDAVGMIGSSENRLGATSTAGTGFSQFILGGLAWKGESAHGLSKSQRSAARAAERELEGDLRLNPSLAREHDAANTKDGLDRHDKAIVELGIRDRAGKLLPGAADSKGNYSEPAVEKLIENYAKTHTADQITNIMTAAFETRGARFAQPYTTRAGIDREHEQIETYKNAPTVQKELQTLQGLPIQQFEQMLSNLANTGNILAESTLKPLNDIFVRTNLLLIGFNNFLTKHQPAAEIIDFGTKGALVGAAVGGLVGLFGGGVGIIPGMAAGAAIGGAIGAGGATAHVYGNQIKSAFSPSDPSGGGFDFHPSPMFPWVAPPGQAMPAATAPGSPQAAAVAPQVTVNMTNNNTLNGVPDDSSLNVMLKKITDGLRDALSHMMSDASGTGMSAYTQPGP